MRVIVSPRVDEDDPRPARDDGIKVHLVKRPASVFDMPARNDLKSVKQRLGLLAPVGLDNADDDIVAVLLPRPRGLQHRVGLTDTGGRADEDAELSGMAVFKPGSLQQGFRRRPLLWVASLLRHQE